jgi:ligand-binding SRPBCC domain-containing protein
VGVWIGQVGRSVTAVVPAAPEVVRDFYVDLDNLARIHPLVVAVAPLGCRGDTREYRVTDRIRLGPVTLRIRYAVTLTTRGGEVLSVSRQFPRVRLHTRVSFVARGETTVLTEDMRIEAPRPLLGLTARQAVAAHEEMLAGVAAHFSSVR